MLHIITILAMATAIALGIYLAYFPYEEGSQYLAMVLAVLVPVGPFKVLEQVESIAYKLKLPQELSRVHNMFHVSNLRKCYADEPLAVPLGRLYLDNELWFVEKPVEVMNREVKQLRQSRNPIVKVRWNSRQGPELHVLRRLGSFFTSVYAAKVYKAGKRLLYVKRNKAISLGKGASKVGIEVQQLSLKDSTCSHKYLNDLEEYQARALLAKSKIFFKKVTQRFSSAKATDQTECHKCGEKGHFARDCWSKALVPSYQSPFKPKPLNFSQHKLELSPTKDFEAKYNKVRAKLALLSSSASASKAATVKNKGLIAEACEWDEEEVSSDDNEMVKVKVLMALAEENDAVSKEGARSSEWVKISMRKAKLKSRGNFITTPHSQQTFAKSRMCSELTPARTGERRVMLELIQLCTSARFITKARAHKTCANMQRGRHLPETCRSSAAT
ncbi:retrovirus-related pol polyprotein from transposon TNT 1-94 [Tanacetum coccineum]